MLKGDIGDSLAGTVPPPNTVKINGNRVIFRYGFAVRSD